MLFRSEIILDTYEILNEHLKLGIKIHSAGEWILDNFYIIEETVKNIEKNIKLKQYIKLPGIANRKISRICTNICISK